MQEEYLVLHPLCQLTLAKHRFDEAEVLAIKTATAHGYWFKGVVIPWANQIHHRNKCNGARLTDARWFASACGQMHGWVEDHKEQARAEGYLLPIEADPDGRLPNGGQCLTTDQWLAARSRLRAEVVKNAVDGMG